MIRIKQHSCRQQRYRYLGVFCLTLLYSSANFAQTQQHDHSDHNHNDDRFTAIGESWPPQPSNIENVIWLTPAVTNTNVQGRMPRIEAVAASDPQVNELLGERYVVIGTESENKKNAPSNAIRVTYFSHSNNLTLEVSMSNQAVASIDIIEPVDYQPPLTAIEVAEAIALAQADLVEQGFTDAAALEGYGILALKGDNNVSDFYNTRVVYVSFHAHVDARPEYVALVDISNQVVLESREDR